MGFMDLDVLERAQSDAPGLVTAREQDLNFD